MSVTITRFAAPTASVNSWLVSDETSVVIVDVLRSSAEAASLAKEVAATGKQVRAVLVTHGHPDHYIGLRTFREWFPDVPLIAGSEGVRNDILGFSQWMESAGWLEDEPGMKPYSQTNPDGFDYDVIGVASPQLSLAGGTILHLDRDWPAVEADHMTVVHVPAANALLTSDLVYSGVHAWEGPEVTRSKIMNWITSLDTLESRYGSDVDVCPGHGPQGSTSRYDEIRRYLNDFLDITAFAITRQQATEEMARRYPDHSQADFLLAMSIDFHVNA
ncbi:MBL fold metallo-hydrolase [Streptomyces sp. NPDC048362]|uniref:MBL fold metallo-hydrolase n=1 Tax=Streptomyces sp. NPDC048362 TaxID=3365539 RepID=UPI0037153891